MHQHPNGTARTHPPTPNALQKMTNHPAMPVWREFFEENIRGARTDLCVGRPAMLRPYRGPPSWVPLSVPRGSASTGPPSLGLSEGRPKPGTDGRILLGRRMPFGIVIKGFL
jgi:hypothetical protein